MSALEKPATISGGGDPPLKDIVAESPFFSGLNEAHQKTLVQCAMFQRFAEGEKIFCEGDPANRFYLILDGEIALEADHGEGEPLLIQKVGAGDVLGWSWLFPPYYWHFGARATKPTTAIFFYGTRLRQICEEEPAFGYELMRRIAEVVVQRLQATRKELIELSQRRS